MALDLFKTRARRSTAEVHLEGAGPAAVQQARRRRVHPRARHPDERHRGRGAALQPRLRAHERASCSAPLARVRRIEQHQQTLVNWLNPADQSPLETTIGFEQVAIEVTASVAQHEPDPYLAQVYRFGLLEDFDHLYRYSALMDRRRGQGRQHPPAELHRHPARAGRPSVEHRAPDGRSAPPVRPHARPRRSPSSTRSRIMAGEHQTHDYYMTIGPMFADPLARQLYAEIASIEEQHVTQYESIIDPSETWLEKWLLHEADRGLQLLELRRVRGATRASRRSGSASSTTSSASCTSSRAVRGHRAARRRRGPARHAARADRVREPPRVRARDAGARGRPARARDPTSSTRRSCRATALVASPRPAQHRGLALRDGGRRLHLDAGDGAGGRAAPRRTGAAPAGRQKRSQRGRKERRSHENAK